MVLMLHPPQNFNLKHFKIVDAVGLKLSHRGALQRHHLPTKFHENLQIGSRVIRWTERQTGDLISLFSFLKNMFKNKLCAIGMEQSPHG
jgi:hypothetical protein